MDQALHFFFVGFQKGMLALDSRFLKASTYLLEKAHFLLDRNMQNLLLLDTY